MELYSPFLKANQECKDGKQIEKSSMKKLKRTAILGHISSTSYSPFYTYHMWFWSLGSQESNASNGVQIRAEMKKLWPLEDNHTKLKSHIQLAKSKFNLQNGQFNLRNFHKSYFNLRNPPVYSRYLRPTLLDFFLQIFVV